VVPALSPIRLRHASPSWKEHGEDGRSVLSVQSRNRFRRQQQHGPPYFKFLHGPSIGGFRGSRRGTRNPEGYPEGDVRWRKRGASAKSSERVTRFISPLREISGVVPIQWTSVFPRQGSRHLRSLLLYRRTFSRL